MIRQSSPAATVAARLPVEFGGIAHLLSHRRQGRKPRLRTQSAPRSPAGCVAGGDVDGAAAGHASRPGRDSVVAACAGAGREDRQGRGDGRGIDGSMSWPPSASWSAFERPARRRRRSRRRARDAPERSAPAPPTIDCERTPRSSRRATILPPCPAGIDPVTEAAWVSDRGAPTPLIFRTTVDGGAVGAVTARPAPG